MSNLALTIKVSGYTVPTNFGTVKSSASEALYLSVNHLFDEAIKAVSSYTELHPMIKKDKSKVVRLSKLLIQEIKDMKINFLHGMINVEEENVFLFSFFTLAELDMLFQVYDSKFHRSFSYYELAEHHAQHTFWHVQMMINQIFSPEVYSELTNQYFNSAA